MDEFLTRQMAKTLRGVGLNGVKKPTLFNIASCDVGRPLLSAEADEALQWLRDRGYVASRVNDFGFEVFWVTEAGRNWLA